ncbi:MAG: hypothetical protein E6Q25_02835 [Acinetobacter sp.]|jgi:hypothetical protein|nr:MAG: hypothetical protein E6Q25_02835 [Acinetobacter sp.]
MNVQEMIQRSREMAANRTPAESLAFLQRANILDQNGHYKEEFFSAETVAASRAKGSKTLVRACVNVQQ